MALEEYNTMNPKRRAASGEAKAGQGAPAAAAIPSGEAHSGDKNSSVIVTAHESYRGAVHRIKQLLYERYGVAFGIYGTGDSGDECWELLEQDLQQNAGGFEHVAQIYDSMEGRAYQYAEETGCRVLPMLSNNVFAYPAYGVAMARIPVYRPHGIGSEDVLFAQGDGALSRFLHHTRRRRRELDRQQVTVFTDGPHGMFQSLAPITVMVDRDEVIMEHALKQEIYRAIDRFFSEDRRFYQEYRVPYKRGILLYGKPGNGKTTLVKSIAGSVSAPTAYWQITEHTCSDTIQEVFEAALAMAPMILIVEDIDSMPERARSYFLNTLDGATSKEGIFLIGTTNYPENIDPALMNRAGRFDRAYEIKLPDAALRLAYLQRKGLAKFAEEAGLQETAKRTEGFTFAQLNELYVSAAMEWFEDGQTNLIKLIAQMNAELHKGRTQVWSRESSGCRIGFITGSEETSAAL